MKVLLGLHPAPGDAPAEHDALVAGILDEALDWLASLPPLNLGIELVLRRGIPSKVHVSADDKLRIRPALEEHCIVRREHDLHVMSATSMEAPAEGRWATRDDVPTLERYQGQYERERGTWTPRDWTRLVDDKGVAVLDRAGDIVSVVCRGGSTPARITIGGTWTFPEHRRRGHAALLTSFVVQELLKERRAVQLVVDDDNDAAVGLYRKLGFERIGGCYFGYLEGR